MTGPRRYDRRLAQLIGRREQDPDLAQLANEINACGALEGHAAVVRPVIGEPAYDEFYVADLEELGVLGVFIAPVLLPRRRVLALDRRVALQVRDAHAQGDLEPILLHELVHAAQRRVHVWSPWLLSRRLQAFERLALEAATDQVTEQLVLDYAPTRGPLDLALPLGAYAAWAAVIDEILNRLSDRRSYQETLAEFSRLAMGRRGHWLARELGWRPSMSSQLHLARALTPLMTRPLPSDIGARTVALLQMSDAIESAVAALDRRGKSQA